MAAMGAVETCHRRCQTKFRGARPGSRRVHLAGRRHGCTSARVRDAERGSAVSTWPRRRKREATETRQAHETMQIKFPEVCLGLGRAGSKGRGEVGQPSRALHLVGERRERLAGACLDRDKGQARITNQTGARVARLKGVYVVRANVPSTVAGEHGTRTAKYLYTSHIVISCCCVLRRYCGPQLRQRMQNTHIDYICTSCLLSQLPRPSQLPNIVQPVPACDVVIRAATSSYLCKYLTYIV
jgi:hypothetical protein